jgi:WD40 repeat protein
MKLRQIEASFCKFSSDEKQIISATSDRNINILDYCVRGHIIKSLEHETRARDSDSDHIYNCSFTSDGKIIISTIKSSLNIQDITSAQSINESHFEPNDEDEAEEYEKLCPDDSLHPDDKQIAVFKDKNIYIYHL